MEVAGQWRRQWAGAAEYGKVTEGGVTRRMARAVEVVQASAPGTRVRLLRAAWHASSGPGAGASYMVHSSRRVISSGSNHLMSSSIVSKPLEISSIPLDISSEGCSEAHSYNVTEPDDHAISEPSKWKGSTRGSSIRMPSEESSSTDNASIIDIDSKLGSLHSTRKFSLDSDNSDVPTFKKRMPSASPLLDTPISLSTLKFKSLLNNTSENWHDRRKSYSFENTSPNEKELAKDDTAMESSTDSGICKSNEKVNDNLDEDRYRPPEYRPSHTPREETFKDWLARNRPKQIFKGVELKPHREAKSPDRVDIPITLQSQGKVLITLPSTNNIQDDSFYLKDNSDDDRDRKMKKVGFCKTELHFAAESGKVNIIATDEKPPPSNEFRRRKSAFVPIQGSFEKPVTLFGDKFDNFAPIDDLVPIKPYVDNSLKNKIDDYETKDVEENLAATKSILKNKIPKPKPYFLGEHFIDEKVDDEAEEQRLRTFNAVTLVNEQLQIQQRMSSKKIDNFKSEPGENNDDGLPKRITNTSPVLHNIVIENKNEHINDSWNVDSKTIKQKLKQLHVSPVMQPKAKTRQLRDSELTYFGINNVKQNNKTSNNSEISDLQFNSVRLIKKAASDMSDDESRRNFDTPEYENLPIFSDNVPVPKPRLYGKCSVSSTYESQMFSSENEYNSGHENILEDTHESETENIDLLPTQIARETSRQRLRNNVTDQEQKMAKSRSKSEPSKYRNDLIKELKYTQQQNQLESVRNHKVSRSPSIEKNHTHDSRGKIAERPKARTISTLAKTNSPIYENISIMNKKRSPKKLTSSKMNTENNNEQKCNDMIDDIMNRKKMEAENDNIKTSKSEKVLRTSTKIKSAKNQCDQKNEKQMSTDSTLSRTHSKKSDQSLKNKSHLQKHTSERSPNKHQKPFIESIPKILNSVSDTNRLKTQHTQRSHSGDHAQLEKESDERCNKENEFNLNSIDDIKDGKKTVHKRAQSIQSRKDPEVKYRSRKNEMSKHREGTKTFETCDINDTRRDLRNKSGDRDKSKGLSSITTKQKPHQSEYVINYDDKNGTFSSINKIKHSSRTRDKMKTVANKKADKESDMDNKIRSKLRIPLLQSAREHRIFREDRKRKSKTFNHYSCQLL